MARKLWKISQGFLAGLLIYLAFISILYFRMKNAEKALTDYYAAQSCPSSSNCREVVNATILKYGSKRVSFQNYGSRGVPLESGIFREYVFTISRDNSKTETVKILPCTPSDMTDFDVAKVYIPAPSDEIMANSSLFDGQSISVETWHGRTTLMFMSVLVPVNDQTNQTTPQEAVSIGPLKQELHELVLPTGNHPVIRAELTKQDFHGWTAGILLGLGSAVFGAIIFNLFYGLDWIYRKGFRRKRENSS